MEQVYQLNNSVTFSKKNIMGSGELLNRMVEVLGKNYIIERIGCFLISKIKGIL